MFNGTTVEDSWTDLDLSSAVGQNTSFVLLKFVTTNANGVHMFIRPNGDTDEFHYEGDKKIRTKAITRYTVIDSNINYSFLKLNPITGRKHQLRKQLLIHGHPVLGDAKYRISVKRTATKDFLMLHAYEINFFIDNTKYKFVAEPPSTFKKNLKEKFLRTSLQ